VELATTIRTAATLALRDGRSQFVFDLAPDLHPVLADADQIGQVVANLVINADQAAPVDGIITLRAANHTLSTVEHGLPPGDYVRWEVSDRGAGIAAEHLPLVFDPFFTTKHQGSGLGLAVVHSVIARHRGHVAVTSAPGAGTTVSVLLPACRAEPRPAEIAESRRRSRRLRVLLLEDDETVAEVVSRMLSHLGHDVKRARDGGAAVAVFCDAQAAGQPFDVAILDLTVPGGMGGRETVERLHALAPTLPAIASSGYSTEPLLADPAAHGFAAGLRKPFTPEELAAALAHAVCASP
jgi:CheY-like chemotaxis protein